MDNPAAEGVATYYDGATAARREVRLRFADTLEIVFDGAVLARWPYADCRAADGGPGVARIACLSAAPLARIDTRDDATRALLKARCPRLGAADLGRRDVAKIAFWSLAAAASLAVLAVYGVPLAAARLTPLVPASFEARLGAAVEKQVSATFGDRRCAERDGAAALDALAAKLAGAGGLSAAPPVAVLTSATPNAFALPGGHVYVLSALIDKAEDADELAGVVAHEFGHVAHRDGLRELIANGGTAFLASLLFGDVTGAGAIVFATRTLLNSARSREAETAADAFAADAMRALGRS